MDGGNDVVTTTTSESGSSRGRVEDKVQLPGNVQKVFNDYISRLFFAQRDTPGFTPGPNPNAATARSEAAALDYGLRIAPELAKGTKSTFDFLTNPSLLYAYNNPYLQSHINAAAAPLIKSVAEGAIPGLAQTAASAGAFGGARHGIREGMEMDALQREIANITTRMAADNYARQLGLMSEAALASPAVLSNIYGSGINTLAATGEQIEARQRERVEAPWRQLALFREGLAPLQSLFGTTRTTRTDQKGRLSGVEPSNQPSAFNRGLGGAATGAAIGSLFPGYGTAIGAGLGGLGGLLFG